MIIKQVIRDGIVETNSSSSHSVSICMHGPLAKPGSDVWNLDIRDGILYIPCRSDFGWDYFRANDCQTKLLYICAHYFRGTRSVKHVKKLTSLLKSFLGVKKVVYEWEEDFKKKCAEGIDPEDIWVACPTIDHQSLDLDDELLENTNTIKNFIFNPQSWLYGGNDNSDGDPKDFKIETEINDVNKIRGLISVELGGTLGRLDIPLHDPEDFMRDINSDDILRCISWDPGSKEFIFYHGKKENTLKQFVSFKVQKELLFTGGPGWIELRKTLNLDSPWKSDSEIVEKGLYKNLTDGVDYKILPFDIKLFDYDLDRY